MSKGISRRGLLFFWQKKDESTSPAPPPPRTHLRPPGAIAESDFLTQCIRCGECINVCPAEAIVALDEAGPGFGTPIVNARSQACVLCNGLQCTQTCPSGALQPLRFHHEVRMGTAVVDDKTCKLTHGEACGKCVTECPVPYAISDSSGAIVVDARVCIGCGGCEQACPTEPTSIRIIAK